MRNVFSFTTPSKRRDKGIWISQSKKNQDKFRCEKRMKQYMETLNVAGGGGGGVLGVVFFLNNRSIGN